MKNLAIILAAAVGLCTAASAQDRTVERTAKGATNKNIRIGIYVNVLPDCTSAPLPTIRLVKPPEHGKVTVKKAKMNATNYKQCLALQVPALIAFYQSAAGYSGTDSVTLEVKFPHGRTEVQNITVTVTDSGERI